MVRRSAITLESECVPEQRSLLLRILSENSFTDRHMEIGTAAGGTLKELIGIYSGRDYCPEFVVIDKLTYYEGQFEKICENLHRAGIDPSTVSFWKGTTGDFLDRERRAGGTFDFIFIDASHKHYPVTVDLQWADLVRKDGIICLHDYSERFPGVIWAVNRFLNQNSNFRLHDRVGSMVALVKTREGQTPAISRSDLRAAGFVQWRSEMSRRVNRIVRKILPVSA